MPGELDRGVGGGLVSAVQCCRDLLLCWQSGNHLDSYGHFASAYTWSAHLMDVSLEKLIHPLSFAQGRHWAAGIA